MKKIIYSLGLFALLSLGNVAYGETATESSTSSAATAQSLTGNSSSSSLASSSTSSQNVNSNEQTSSSPQSQTQTSTTAQNQTNNVEQSQNQNQPTPPPSLETKEPTATSSDAQKETKNSTTIINETVNNGAKGNNILLVTLSCLSASVTIIGGVIAFVRHLRNRAKKKASVSKKITDRDENVPINSLTESSVKSKKATEQEKILTETQQLNLEADELIKNHKKEQKQYRRRRK